jgi:transcriptional regulator with XRE-family HTH domain
MMKDTDAFWQWIERRMEEVGISSFRELERKAGVSTGLISSRKNDLKLPTVQMAEGLCQALQVSWIDLWERAGLIQRLSTDQLTGLDAEIHQTLQGASDEFKQAALKTIRAWLVAWEDKN